MRTGKERRLDMESHHDRMERDKQDDKTVARFKKRPYSIWGGAIPMDQNIKKENEEKKKYLRGYRKHSKRIKRIEAEIEEIRSMKMYPSIKNDGMPKGSCSNDAMPNYAAELQEKEDELYHEGVEQVKMYKDISYKIKQLKDEDERDVLFYRYIKGFEWWEVAKSMNYSESWIHELHGKALKNIQIS